MPSISVLRLLFLVLVCALPLTRPALALTLLRDPDIEYALNKLAAPVIKAAGLSPARINVLVIDDPSMNAFVVDQSHIFLHSGLMLRMNNAPMLQSVLAHEVAHIANGHLSRRPIAVRNARTAAGIGAALAVAAGLASGRGDVGYGVALGAQNTAARLLMSHTRAEENAADQSAVRFMASAGIDPRGAVEVMEIFRGQDALSESRQDPYARTHPMSSDRYRVLKQQADAHAGKARPQPEFDYWFARAKGKLSAFQRAPKWTMGRAGEHGFADVKAMRESVAWLRQSNLKRALAAIDQAIAVRPKDPFYRELKGQILMDNRQFAAAANIYGQAVNLAPENALILGSYGRALLATGDVSGAQKYLEASRARDPGDSRVLHDLAAAYAKSGNAGMASVLTAERYALRGRMKDAAVHAKRASDQLPRGSVGWTRAQDILAAAAQMQRKR